MSIKLLIAFFVVWLLTCCWAGYRRSVPALAFVLVLGLAASTAWMVLGLNADPTSHNAMMVHLAAIIYAICGFTFGWLISRMVTAFRNSRVDP